MKLNEITKTGFYCVVDDTERSYIFEVLNNTDKNWLKENPKATLLIDEWIYDYTDYDDRKVYSTSGNLVSLCFETSNAQVYRIEDTKYKIYGNAGLYLIEDKPTYKELFQAEREKVKELKEENKKFKQFVASQMFYTDCENWLERFIYTCKECEKERAKLRRAKS